MFGYVTVCKPELKIREYERYHAFYCGLCKALKEQHGICGQMTLTYDMTFLVILLTSLYEPKTQKRECRCMAHPAKKHTVLTNEMTYYAADMNILLVYHNFADDWMDEGSIKAAGGMHVFRKDFMKISMKYPSQAKKIRRYLNQLYRLEQENCSDVDRVSACFGKLMGTLFCCCQDGFSEYLKKMGFYLGKFIYLMDAIMDLEEDQKNGSYNPLLLLREQSPSKEAFEEMCDQMLTCMIADCAREFEKLPLIQDIEILKNILYAGVWQKYDRHRSNIQKGRTKDDK